MAQPGTAVDLEDLFANVLRPPTPDPNTGYRPRQDGADTFHAPFVTFNDMVADDMLGFLLDQDLDRSPSPFQPLPALDLPHMALPPHRQVEPDHLRHIDLTASDDGPFGATPDVALSPNAGPSQLASGDHIFSEAACLAHVLEVLPDISHEHVRKLFRASPPVGGHDPNWIQAFINNILESGKYPTQKESARGTKRKHRSEEDDWAEFERADPDDLEDMYKVSGYRLLRDEFPDTRYTHIQAVFKKHKSVFKAYAKLLQHASEGVERLEKPRKRTRRDTAPPSADTDPVVDLPPGAMGSEGFARAQKEMRAARQKRAHDAERTRLLQAAALAEQQNELQARHEGTVQECGCCCSDYPLNRMIICENSSASTPHWLCWGCVKTHVETEIGQSRHKIVCFHVDGCTSGFSTSQLGLAVPQQQLDKLGKLQQEDEIRRAELEGLEECPFCDFKAICPPREVDKEFRCGNPDCGVVSCRLCQLETHVPLSCEEKAKEKGIDARHTIEEAMTAALIRKCNKCKRTFIKDFGCNKMSCAGCGNLQCYVCGKDVKDYRHFSSHDKRHQDEVEKAEKKALQQVREAHPDLQDDDLRIKVSEAVKHGEAQNIRRIDEAYGFAPEGAPGRQVNVAAGRGHEDYEMQLRLLEHQNLQRRHLLRVRGELQPHRPQAALRAADVPPAARINDRPGQAVQYQFVPHEPNLRAPPVQAPADHLRQIRHPAQGHHFHFRQEGHHQWPRRVQAEFLQTVRQRAAQAAAVPPEGNNLNVMPRVQHHVHMFANNPPPMMHIAPPAQGYYMHMGYAAMQPPPQLAQQRQPGQAGQYRADEEGNWPVRPGNGP